jgi:hypothetical protein
MLTLALTLLLGAAPQVAPELDPKTYGGTRMELPEPRVLPVLGSRLNVKFKTAVLISPDGIVRAGILAGDTTLGVMGDNLNVTFKDGTIAAFAGGYEESKPGVYQGVLAQTVVLNVYKDGTVLAQTIKEGTKVQFSHYPGKYDNRSLASPME